MVASWAVSSATDGEQVEIRLTEASNGILPDEQALGSLGLLIPTEHFVSKWIPLLYFES